MTTSEILKTPPIYAGCASIPEREDALYDAVSSLYEQVDRMFVYLNGYDHVPKWLFDTPRIHVTRSQEAAGDIGDAGKFFHAEVSNPVWFLTFDDDLIYPEDFACRLAEKLIIYGTKSVISCHGWNARKNQAHYHDDRAQLYHFANRLDSDMQAHVVATCGMIFGTDTIKADHTLFKIRNCTDLIFSMYCNEIDAPRIVINKPEGWVRQNEKVDVSRSIFARDKVDRWRLLTDALNSIQWKHALGENDG